jgi:SAM-dependent methyltransferase
MTMAALAEEYSDKAAIYTQAWTEDPSRAEPLYELTALSLSCEQPERGLNYARHMMNCKWPENPCWNHRKMFYGFFREDLFLQALRINGHPLESDTRRGNMLATSGKTTISLLHATRGRPLQAIRTRMEWLRMADHPERVEHLFAADYNDEEAEVFLRFPTAFLQGDGGPVAAWNAAAASSRGDILLQLSDDWKPFRGWDTQIVDAIGDTSKPAVLAVHDGYRKDDLLCMAILTRARYKEQGNLFHPEFFSMFSDNHFSQQAFKDGVVIEARDRITFEHMHPAFGKSEMDATYARSNDTFHYKSGEGIMRRLTNGVCVSTDVEGWCDYRSLYSGIAKALPDDAQVVEIGSWQGQSIIHLCQRLQDIDKRGVVVHCVDTFLGEQNQPEHLAVVDSHGGSIRHVFEDNIKAAGVADMIQIHQGDSAESAADFADESLDFIHIDAAHDYDSVVKDLAAWYPKLKPGGIFSGHDYPWHEVKKAVGEHAAANDYTVARVGRCWIKTNEKP